MASRKDRATDELRKVEIICDYTKWAEGSVLCCFGDTKVLCNATVEERVPGWMRDQGRGWITAEYAMLPRSTDTRNGRESLQGRVGGRTHEISRLIGRSLRAGVDLVKLGERKVTLDCDVIQADGGTRTAAITGAWVAMSMAMKGLEDRGAVGKNPIKDHVTAVSIGIKDGEVLLDLDYKEDQAVDTDLNLVMTGDGGIVEVQGTAEGTPFTRAELDKMLDVGRKGIEALVQAQAAALEAWKAK
ncbi:MAG: ribonuclease PH [Deltaproteobacteria bacterium]